jgi:hypothetical protein
MSGCEVLTNCKPQTVLGTVPQKLSDFGVQTISIALALALLCSALLGSGCMADA